MSLSPEPVADEYETESSGSHTEDNDSVSSRSSEDSSDSSSSSHPGHGSKEHTRSEAHPELADPELADPELANPNFPGQAGNVSTQDALNDKAKSALLKNTGNSM